MDTPGVVGDGVVIVVVVGMITCVVFCSHVEITLPWVFIQAIRFWVEVIELLSDLMVLELSFPLNWVPKLVS